MFLFDILSLKFICQHARCGTFKIGNFLTYVQLSLHWTNVSGIHNDTIFGHVNFSGWPIVCFYNLNSNLKHVKKSMQSISSIDNKCFKCLVVVYKHFTRLEN